MRRTRTTKSLSARHDRDYFKAWTPLRRLKVGLAVTVPLLALLWVLVTFASGDKSAYASGPISRAHAVFAKQCGACHSRIVNGRRVQGFVNQVSDEACQTCHAAPMHQQTQCSRRNVLPATWSTSAVSIWNAPRPPTADRKSTRLNSSHIQKSRMPSSA